VLRSASPKAAERSLAHSTLKQTFDSRFSALRRAGDSIVGPAAGEFPESGYRPPALTHGCPRRDDIGGHASALAHGRPARAGSGIAHGRSPHYVSAPARAVAREHVLSTALGLSGSLADAGVGSQIIHSAKVSATG
jgi:hypothetical protein